MKYFFVFFLIVFTYNAANCQQKVDLVANYFPGMIPGEAGLNLSDFEYPFQTWSFVQFFTPVELTELNNDSTQVKFFSFIVAKDDTTCTYIQEYDSNIDTIHFYKDSLNLTRAHVIYFDVETGYDYNASSNYICKDELYKYKFYIKVEKLTKKSCQYSLYYNENCGLPTEQDLIRYGKIKFRRHRNYKALEYH